jgi:hypothetical protein
VVRLPSPAVERHARLLVEPVPWPLQVQEIICGD